MSKAASLTLALAAALVLAAPAGAGAESARLRHVAALTIDGIGRPLGGPLPSSPGTSDVYTDPAGDNQVLAADITTSTVTNTPEGVITFDVDTPNVPTLRAQDLFAFFIDVDLNPATGDTRPGQDGTEVLILIDGSVPGYAVGRWNGTGYAQVAAPSAQVSWAGGPVVSISRADLGVTNGLNFWEGAISDDGVDPPADPTPDPADFAPDTGTYRFMLTLPSTPPPPPPPPPDTQAPNTAILSAPPASTRSRSARFRFSSTEPGSQFQCKLDGRPWRACISPATYRNLGVGLHVFRVRAIDRAGNVDASPARKGWRVRR